MKIRLLLMSVFFWGGLTLANGQTKVETAKINWLSWDQAMAKSKENKRKILVDVFTSWCKWCDRMDEVTYQDPKIVKYINDNYYAVKLDAEYKEDLQYLGKTYSFVKEGKNGYHELAAVLLNGRLSFPSTAFLDEEQNLIQSIMGYKSPASFECILSYIGANHYKSLPWSTYEQRNCQAPPNPLQKPEKQNANYPNNQPPGSIQRLIKN